MSVLTFLTKLQIGFILIAIYFGISAMLYNKSSITYLSDGLDSGYYWENIADTYTKYVVPFITILTIFVLFVLPYILRYYKLRKIAN